VHADRRTEIQRGSMFTKRLICGHDCVKSATQLTLRHGPLSGGEISTEPIMTPTNVWDQFALAAVTLAYRIFEKHRSVYKYLM